MDSHRKREEKKKDPKKKGKGDEPTKATLAGPQGADRTRQAGQGRPHEATLAGLKNRGRNPSELMERINGC